MVHRRAKLTPLGRFELVMRVVRDGWPVARVAEGSVVSRQTVHTWVRRYRAEGVPGLEDRSSRPKYSPRRLSPEQESRILAARRSRRWGPDRLGPALRLPSSTVYAVLARNHCSRLTDFDRPTGKPIRYQRERRGEQDEGEKRSENHASASHQLAEVVGVGKASHRNLLPPRGQ